MGIGDVEVPETLFAEISTVSFGPLNIAFAMGKFDGILGLGFSKISSYGIPTAFEMMVQKKLIDEPVFSFCLQKDASQPGQLTFGGVDHSKFDGEIQYVPLTDESYWKVSLEGMKYGSTDITSKVSAIIDSGTSLLAGPNDKVSKIAEAAGATLVMGKEYTIDCSKMSSLPAVEITLGGGKKFTLEGKDYVLQVQGQCLFAFMPIELPPKLGEMWILGDVFMRKYYTIFDYGNKQVGFATFKTQATVESPQATCDHLCPGFVDGDCTCNDHGQWAMWICKKKGGQPVGKPYFCSQPTCNCNQAQEDLMI